MTQRDEKAGEQEKTLIGVLASHDNARKHKELAESLNSMLEEDRKRDPDDRILPHFHFVFTGGTFKRLVLGSEVCLDEKERGLRPGQNGTIGGDPTYEPLRKFLLENSTALPDRAGGGLILLANLVVHHQCELLWLFLSPDSPHWVNVQNLAVLRLSDVSFAKKYMNEASVRRWFETEALRDARRNPQGVRPLRVHLATDDSIPGRPAPQAVHSGGHWEVQLPSDTEKTWSQRETLTIALISHDEMKPRMVDFATQYERELAGFRRILTTGTTGALVRERCHDLRGLGKIRRCQSGPYGGDLEVAAEVISGRCQVVVFFVDSLNPHPHIEDIRSLFAACMMDDPSDDVLMLSNEVQAREWFDTLRCTRERGDIV